jgi:glycosyltransferase involved in cell wall biosynthesis
MAPTTDVAVIILTFNEEFNLPQALSSVRGWAREIHVLDSGSTDKTLEIAAVAGCVVTVHTFEDYSRQRNFALDYLPISAEWILFLDADEWLTESLKEEIARTLAGPSCREGFYIKRRLMWLGREIRWGGYSPTWLLRLFRRGTGRCEERPINEHIIVAGEVGRLQNDLIHDDRKGLSDWIAKHNRYSTLEANELLRQAFGAEMLPAKLFGSAPERKRWIRRRIWNHLPPFVRPFLFFAYRFLFLLGFLDGYAGFSFYLLHGFWLPLLIDAKYYEMRLMHKAALQ